MTQSRKTTGTAAATTGPAALSQLTPGDTSFGRRFWESMRVLAWIEDERGGVFHCEAQCRLSSPLPEAGDGQSRSDLEPHSAADSGNSERFFLVVRFPFDGGTRRYLAHVALDVSRQHAHLDELLRLAVEDELTGLYNRRGFMLFAEHELRAARRRDTHSAVMVIDVDGLKGVNDSRGHDHGDALLVETGRLLRDVFRDCDVIARLGGDEFALFVADVRGDPEMLRARLRARLAEVPSMKLRLSAGLAFSRAGQSRSLIQLLADADVAMYADKAGKPRAP